MSAIYLPVPSGVGAAAVPRLSVFPVSLRRGPRPSLRRGPRPSLFFRHRRCCCFFLFGGPPGGTGLGDLDSPGTFFFFWGDWT